VIPSAARRPAPGDIRYRAADLPDLPALLDIDRDASELFDRAGLHLDLPDTHEFSVTERERIRASIAAAAAIVAFDGDGVAAGFIALGLRDGAAYVEQLSVRARCMRRGIGSTLLAMASVQPLWLTTYDHLPWNRPFYERRGFAVVAEDACGTQLRDDLEFQRRWLPLPGRRVAMRRG
jgi:GNAT superfamily N-acetyltransferase